MRAAFETIGIGRASKDAMPSRLYGGCFSVEKVVLLECHGLLT